MTNPLPQALIDPLLTALTLGGPPAGLAWLHESIDLIRGTAPGTATAAVLRACPSAARRLGDAVLGTAGPWLDGGCGGLGTGHWSRGDAGRACLLLAGMAAGAEPVALADGLFRNGDEGERVSLVRALCLLPEPCAALATARAAGRINSLRLYAALALDNPFPAACYGERDFNQVVLKCLFNGLPTTRIRGLAARANPDLARMCEDYHDERIAAGRAVPADIWLALVPMAGRRGLELAIARCADADPAQRHHAGQALAARLATETDPALRELLRAALDRAAPVA